MGDALSLVPAWNSIIPENHDIIIFFKQDAHSLSYMACVPPPTPYKFQKLLNDLFTTTMFNWMLHMVVHDTYMYA